MIAVYYLSFNNTLSKIRVNSLNISSSENEASKANFSVLLETPDSDIPNIGNEIVIMSNSQKLFAGYIISRSFEFYSKQKYWEVTYEAIDYNHILDRYVIQPISFIAVSVFDIVKHILTNTDLAKEYIGNWTQQQFKREPIDLTNVAKQLMIANFKTGYTIAKNVFKEIQKFYPELKFWIDYNRNLYIYRDKDKAKDIEIDFTASTPIIFDTKKQETIPIDIYSFSLEEDSTDFRNRQFVKGASTKEQKEDIITINKLEELKKSNFYLNATTASEIKNKYNIDVPSELYEEYYTTPIIRTKNDTTEIRYLFVVPTSFIISGTAQVEYELDESTKKLSNSKEYQPKYGEPPPIPEEEENKVKAKAVVIVWKHRTKNLYAVAMEGIDKGEYDSESGEWRASGTNFWFFIPNTSYIWRHAPIKKTITVRQEDYDLYEIRVGIVTSKALVVHAFREGYKINDMFNPIKPEKYDGGYWDDIVSENSVETIAEAKTIAERHLDVYCKIPMTATMECSYPFLQPGDDVTIKFPVLFPNGKRFRVKETKTEDIGGKLLRTRISFIGSEKLHWIEFFRRLIARTQVDVEVEDYILYTIGSDKIKAKDNLVVYSGTLAGLVEISHVGEGNVW